MLIFQKTPNFNFMGKRRIAAAFSILLIIVSLGSLIVNKLNFGIDFTGGTVIEIAYPEAVELNHVREALSNKGYKDVVVQHFGTARDVLIRVAPKEEMTKAKISNEIYDTLRAAQGENLDLRRVEFVGPQVGEELTEEGGLAMLIALFCIMVYVALRFEYRFALGSVVALAHDVIIVLGFFSVLKVEFDLTVLAAILAVIGYSLNDTIVVFDRVRENFRLIRRGTPVEIMNTSLNQTLSRTLMTSITTLIVLVALFLLGGELIHAFATALIIGVFVGTYSSIFVASTTALALGVSKEDLMKPEKTNNEADSLP